VKRTQKQKWMHLAVATLACGLLAPGAVPADESDKNQREGERQAQAEGEGEKRKTRQLKAFDLEHRDPQQFQQILALRGQGARPGAFGAQQQFPGRSAPGVRPPGQQGVGSAQDAGQDRLSIAIDAESKVLFVRGSEDQIEEVEKLVEAFDKPSDELEKHEFGDTRLIPVSQEQSQRVRATLAQLQLEHQMVSLGDVSLIAICPGDSDAEKQKAEQVEEVVAKLKADKKPAEGASGDDDDSNSNGQADE
jgi:hypothetical protein